MIDFNFKKKYGQNFLVDENICNKIVDTIEIKPNSLVIEIGCGDGRLTSKLCEKFDFVLGYEIDEEVKDNLYKRLEFYNNYKIIFSDFLKRDFESDIDKKFDHIYVVANLPYYITTPIIEKLTESNISFELIRVMVQKEVGDRFKANIGTKNYSSLSIYLDYNYDVVKDFIVSRNCFYPKPNVDSLIISLHKKIVKYKISDISFFYRLVRDSFKYKRKTLRNNLKEYNLSIIESVLKEYDYDLSVRAEQLSTKVFCDIANGLYKNN